MTDTEEKEAAPANRPWAMSHHFPAPWSFQEREGGFVIKDAKGRALAFLVFDNDAIPSSYPRLTRDEARRLAANMSQLPVLMLLK
jgi:hypothetical protein